MHCHGLGNGFAPSPNFTPYHPTSAPTPSHVHFHAPTLWRVCDPTKIDNTKKEGGHSLTHDADGAQTRPNVTGRCNVDANAWMQHRCKTCKLTWCAIC